MLPYPSSLRFREFSAVTVIIRAETGDALPPHSALCPPRDFLPFLRHYRRLLEKHFGMVVVTHQYLAQVH